MSYKDVDGNDCDGNGRLIPELAEAAESQVERLKQALEWIPVRERLPENDASILLWNGIVVFGRYERFASGLEYFAYAAGGECAHVTYWMPLPAPPEARAALESKEGK